MGTIRREDANHILRHLTSKLEWIAKTYCLRCEKAVFDEINKVLTITEQDLWGLKEMKEATLLRLEHAEQETIGILKLDGRIVCYTLEDPPTLFQIPIGSYVCKRMLSPRFGETFEITGIPGHDLVEFHWGNTHRDTRGCILTGSYPTWWDNEVPPVRAVSESKKAFRRFMALMEGVDEFRLSILSIEV